ncbi:unnamed protein product, partial [Polarella glacialis]
KEYVVGRCSLSVEEVLKRIAKSPVEAAVPQARKLHAPLGLGPYEDLVDSYLKLGFAQPNGDDSIECIIASAEALPSGAMGTRCYVRACSRQVSGDKARQLPAKFRTKTSAGNTSSPWWNEILEFEVPVFLTGRTLTHSPDIRLVFRVYDRDIVNFTSSDYLAELVVPLADVLRADGLEAKPYPMSLGGAAKGQGDKLGWFGKNAQAGDTATSTASSEAAGKR